MHGHQLQVELRRHQVASRSGFREQMKAGNFQSCKPKVKPHQPGKHHAGNCRHQRQAVVLLSDDLMVQAENVLANEALRRRVMSYVGYMSRRIRHALTSKGPRAAEWLLLQCC